MSPLSIDCIENHIYKVYYSGHYKVHRVVEFGHVGALSQSETTWLPREPIREHKVANVTAFRIPAMICL